jgi:hypothetical protein
MSNVTEVKISSAAKEFNDAINGVYHTTSKADKEAARKLVMSDGGKTEIGPSLAAVLFKDHNGKNRSLVYSRANDYADAMARGEWRFNHQGIAFNEDGDLIDGQHRIAAVVLSGKEQLFMITTGLENEAIDTVDRSVRRSIGESLEMRGYTNGRLKANVAKDALSYMAEVQGEKKRFSDQQIEAYVMEKNDLLDEALAIGTASTLNVSDACLSKAVASKIAHLMFEGLWPKVFISGYLASIQQGIGSYQSAPSIVLEKQFMRSKISDKRKDRLTTKAKVAMALKGAPLQIEEKVVNKLVWIPKREALPTYVAPEIAFKATVNAESSE